MDLRRAKSRSKLKHALAKLLERKSLEQISIEEITSEAGVTRPTFYSNYPDRQAIILEHIQEWLDELETNLDRYQPDTATPPIERLAAFLQHWFRCIDPNDRILRLTLSGRAGHSALALVRRQSSILLENHSLHALQDITRDEFKLYQAFYGAAINGLVEELFLGEIEMPTEEMVTTIASLVHRGIGHKLKD